jgi:hypothetical protein
MLLHWSSNFLSTHLVGLVLIHLGCRHLSISVNTVGTHSVMAVQGMTLVPQFYWGVAATSNCPTGGSAAQGNILGSCSISHTKLRSKTNAVIKYGITVSTNVTSTNVWGMVSQPVARGQRISRDTEICCPINKLFIILTVVPCSILILSKFYYQLMHNKCSDTVALASSYNKLPDDGH